MLQGGQELLSLKLKPIWIIEISIDEHQPKGTKINPSLIETFEIFLNKGYKSYIAEKNLTEITIEQIQKICNQKQNTLKFHNFIFLDKFYPKEVLEKLRNLLCRI